MRILSIITLISLISFSCGKNRQQPPKIDYSDPNRTDSLTIEDISQDTTKTLIATFPVYFDSTNVLIQPSGLVNISDIKNNTEVLERLSSYSKTKDYKEPDFYISGINNDILTGKITNIYFDDLDSNNRQLLTNRILSINSITYLRSIAKKTGKHYLLYSVYDKDTNRDGKLDQNDIRTLYISNLNGTEFQKLTKENHEFANGQLIPIANRYYFTTIEDINKDGKFDREDKYYYYYVDFSATPYEVIEYNPLNN